MYSSIAILRIRQARSSSEGTVALAESTVVSAAPGRPIFPGNVLQYRQLGGGFPLLRQASSAVNCPAALDAAALPMLQQPQPARSH